MQNPKIGKMYRTKSSDGLLFAKVTKRWEIDDKPNGLSNTIGECDLSYSCCPFEVVDETIFTAEYLKEEVSQKLTPEYYL